MYLHILKKVVKTFAGYPHLINILGYIYIYIVDVQVSVSSSVVGCFCGVIELRERSGQVHEVAIDRGSIVGPVGAGSWLAVTIHGSILTTP